jgi:hypothetical protein
VTASEATVGRRAQREAAKRHRARRGQAIAALSSLIVIGSPGFTLVNLAE